MITNENNSKYVMGFKIFKTHKLIFRNLIQINGNAEERL
jgi:hypothetical protein